MPLRLEQHEWCAQIPWFGTPFSDIAICRADGNITVPVMDLSTFNVQPSCPLYILTSVGVGAIFPPPSIRLTALTIILSLQSRLFEEPSCQEEFRKLNATHLRNSGVLIVYIRIKFWQVDFTVPTRIIGEPMSASSSDEFEQNPENLSTVRFK